MILLTEEQQMIRDMAAGFLSDKASVDAFRAQRNAGQSGDTSINNEMAEMGWFGMLTSEDAGGIDMGAQAAGLVAEEMGRNLTTSPFLSSAVMSAAALRVASETEWAGKVASGEAVVALAMDEHIKHRPDMVGTKAEASGNGFVLRGTKRFVGDGGAADRLIVTAMTDDGLGLFLIDPATDGVTVDPVKTVDNRNAANLTLDNVQVDGSALLAKGDIAEEALGTALRVGRSVGAAELVGVSKEAADRTVAYLKERKQFGVTLSQFQALQHRAADLYTQIQTTESVIAAALKAIDEGRDDAERLSRVAKAKASKTANLAVREAVQMHGGIGMTDDLDIGLFMKKARACGEYLGDATCHAEWLLRERGV
ncbi:acyl-CoA dehydrogenase family protein [Shimia thalassica]|uniref:acyl-CoA dehydrogenase family protein n=1 Tax=Shimia thalassica TaxID=1715693 RepID=UPI002736EF3E|nr:acyl-CoA dehydrogenase family protein [Shimia thalassica]MDP2518308.1 acyl-CoA dehydrogenase family protein [Shimia thalassica]